MQLGKKTEDYTFFFFFFLRIKQKQKEYHSSLQLKLVK